MEIQNDLLLYKHKLSNLEALADQQKKIITKLKNENSKEIS